MFKPYTPINIISYNPTEDNKALIYDSVKKTLNLLNYNTEYKKVITNEDLEQIIKNNKDYINHDIYKYILYVMKDKEAEKIKNRLDVYNKNC